MANGKNGNGKTKVTGGTPELRAAAQKQANKATVADLAEAVTVEKEEHTRLAEPGETPETRTGEFETKVRLGADKETHTRLATPQDPEAKKIHEETRKAAKETGREVPPKTPEQVASPKEKRLAAQKLFDKADEDGKAEIIADNQRRNAALGY